MPRCNCGLVGDLESVASLTGIQNNLLPYWLERYPDHPLAPRSSIVDAAKQVRGYAERGDEMALQIFEQQAIAIARMFTIASNFTDPDAYFVGGGVVESRAALPRLVPDTVTEAHAPACPSSERWRSSRSSPTSTWPAPAARPSLRCARSAARCSSEVRSALSGLQYCARPW